MDHASASPLRIRKPSTAAVGTGAPYAAAARPKSCDLRRLTASSHSVTPRRHGFALWTAAAQTHGLIAGVPDQVQTARPLLRPLAATARRMVRPARDIMILPR